MWLSVKVPNAPPWKLKFSMCSQNKYMLIRPTAVWVSYGSDVADGAVEDHLVCGPWASFWGWPLITSIVLFSCKQPPPGNREDISLTQKIFVLSLFDLSLPCHLRIVSSLSPAFLEGVTLLHLKLKELLSQESHLGLCREIRGGLVWDEGTGLPESVIHTEGHQLN